MSDANKVPGALPEVVRIGDTPFVQFSVIRELLAICLIHLM